MALIENIQRADLNYVEEAQSYQALLISQGLSQETLSRRLGKSQSFLSNKLRLLKLSPALRENAWRQGSANATPGACWPCRRRSSALPAWSRYRSGT